MTAKSYAGAIILPVLGCENKALFPNARGGVFDANHKPVEHAFLRREYRKNANVVDGKWDRSTGQEISHHSLILPREIGKSLDKLEGEYIFAGYLFPHYGHFLLESLASLWFILKHPDIPIVWLGVHNQANLNAVNKEFVELYGIENPIYILTKQTEVETLIVPQPGYLIHTRYEPEQVKALKLVDAPPPVSGKKVWLSRSNIGKGCMLNEKTLERILARAGWIIYYPEKHSIRKQLEMLKDAEVVAGVEGSAFHSFVMIPNFRGELHIFARRKSIEFDFVFIAETLGLRQKGHSVPYLVWSHNQPHWEMNSFDLRITPVLDVLGVKRTDVLPRLPASNLAKIAEGVANGVANASKLSLQVELWARQDTVFAVDSTSECLTVSDCLEFDTHALPVGVDHLDLTPDQFATCNVLRVMPAVYCIRHHENLAGLIRAFNNTVTQSAPQTVWVIEYYADERSVSDENKVHSEYRVQSANGGLVKYIDSCCPMVSIARLFGSSVALAWKAPKTMHRPLLEKLAEIESSREFERAPVLSIDQIAKLYSEYLERLKQDVTVSVSSDCSPKKELQENAYYLAGKQFLNNSYYQEGQKANYLESLKTTTRTEVINYLLSIMSGKTCYLEIGVRNPEDNHNHIIADEKYSVDPGLEYDENPVDFDMTSDDFFRLLSKGEILHPKIQFDVIFIDGLHLAEQVDKDIANAMKYVKKNGFIVLHDCNPPTEWHARESFKYYNTPAGGNWNGTTWKAFLKWRFSPLVNSCCIDSDWGVGILSKEREIGRSICETNEFFEFSELMNNRKEYLNLIDFEELKELLRSPFK